MYTNKHLDSFPAAIRCKYESAEPQKHIEQSSENSAWDLFNIQLARNMARELMTDPNNKTTVWEGVSRVSGASHTSQASFASLVGHVIFYTRNGMQSTKSWTSLLSTTASETPPAPHPRALIYPITTLASHLVWHSHSFTDCIKLLMNPLLGPPARSARMMLNLQLTWLWDHFHHTQNGVPHPLELLIPTDRTNQLYWYECTSYRETQTLVGWPKTSNMVC